MKYVFVEESWEDYLYWQKVDKKMLKRINLLIKDITRQPYEGIGKPEPLKHNYRGFWSRRINREHRIVYRIVGKKNESQRIEILICKFHY